MAIESHRKRTKRSDDDNGSTTGDNDNSGFGWEGRAIKIESLESTVASLESELSKITGSSSTTSRREGSGRYVRRRRRQSSSGRENSAHKMLDSRLNTPSSSSCDGGGGSLLGKSRQVDNHFRMIRLENAELLSLLSQRESEMDALSRETVTAKKHAKELREKTEDAKNLKRQLDREKVKTKSLLKQLKTNYNCRDVEQQQQQHPGQEGSWVVPVVDVEPKQTCYEFNSRPTTGHSYGGGDVQSHRQKLPSGRKSGGSSRMRQYQKEVGMLNGEIKVLREVRW